MNKNLTDINTASCGLLCQDLSNRLSGKLGCCETLNVAKS